MSDVEDKTSVKGEMAQAKQTEKFDISEDEVKLLEVVRKMKIKPKVESEEDFEDFMWGYVLGAKEKKRPGVPSPVEATSSLTNTTTGTPPSSTTNSRVVSVTSSKNANLKIPYFLEKLER